MASMRERLLPSDDQVPALRPGPGSITWRRAGDARTLLAAGYVLVLQVAHPTVAAGVSEHSEYRRDPWRRLLRTLDFVSELVYSEPARAAAVARRVRARHRTIRGVTADGKRYHALAPDAYAWVWATLFEGVATAHARFGRPLPGAERELLWAEWRGLGRLLGVRARDLPADLAGYTAYHEHIAGTLLRDSDSVRSVLASLRDPVAPALPRVLAPAWQLGRIPGARALELATVGLLPPGLRERLGLDWTLAQELELRALATATRAAGPLLSSPSLAFGPAYLRWRAGHGASARADAA
jgi:uncharacterized protein (DUF2236 family)